MKRADGNCEFHDVSCVGDPQAMLPHMFDMLGPRIDERHVLARLHHMGASISADGTCSDNGYLPTHAFLPAFLAAEASPPGSLITTSTHIASGTGRHSLASPPFAHLQRRFVHRTNFVKEKSARPHPKHSYR
jgi:hypothetical protein